MTVYIVMKTYCNSSWGDTRGMIVKVFSKESAADDWVEKYIERFAGANVKYSLEIYRREVE